MSKEIIKLSKISKNFVANDKDINVPLASQILSLEGIVMVFFGQDFIIIHSL